MENKINVVKNEIKKEVNSVNRVNISSIFDFESLVLKDDSLKEIVNKKFEKISDDEINKLTWCKCTIQKESNSYRNTSYYSIKLRICEGVLMQQTLSDSEVSIIKYLVPQLFTSVMLVPTKFISFTCKREDDSTYRGFRFISYICDGFSMGSGYYTIKGEKKSRGVFDTKLLKLICISNSRGLSDIKFVDVSKDSLEDDSNDVDEI